MRSISNELKVSKEVLKRSQALVDQLGAMERLPTVELDERIWQAHEANRKALVIADDNEVRRTRTLLDEAKREKQRVVTEFLQQRDALKGEIEEITVPVVEEALLFIEQGIAELYRVADRHRVHLFFRVLYDSGTAKEVETNAKVFFEALDLLTTYKEKITGMKQRPVSEVLSCAGELEERFRAIDLKRSEVIKLKDYQFDDLKALAEPPESRSAGPALPYNADSILERAKNCLMEFLPK